MKATEGDTVSKIADGSKGAGVGVSVGVLVGLGVGVSVGVIVCVGVAEGVTSGVACVHADTIKHNNTIMLSLRNKLTRFVKAA